MNVMLHLEYKSSIKVELSAELQDRANDPYRVLNLGTTDSSKHITVFLTTSQARQIAENILASLEEAREVDQAEAV